MASPNFTEETPLPNLYLQIQYGDSSLKVLGLSTKPSTESDLRDLYRALALRIHPDKAPEGLRELHTSLFQKLHSAYETLAKTLVQDQDILAASTLKQLPETEASLHARNIAFKEALRAARDRAIAAKHAADKYRQVRDARLAAQHAEAAVPAEPGLPGKGKNKSKSWQSTRLKEPKPAQREDFDAPAQDLSRADIDRRWDENLLSGGRSGSVSFALKREREASAAARLLEKQKLIAEQSKRFDVADANDFTEAEATAEQQMDEALDRLEKDVAETHLLKEKERERKAKQDMVWDMGSGAW